MIKRDKQMKKTLLALALASVATTANADSLIYGGAQFGSAETEAPGSSTATDESTVYGAHVGTGLLPFIGLEAGIWNLGSYTYSNGVKADYSSVYFAVKPSLDFGPLHVYAKAGLNSWSAEYNTVADDDGYDPYYGVGAEISVFPMLTIGVGYNNFDVADQTIDFVALNATIHFL